MKPRTAIWIWAATILFATLLTIFDLLDASRMASILPLLAVGSAMHVTALRRRQGIALNGCEA